MTATMLWLLAVVLLGFATGLRSMTPMAVLCWFAYFGRLPVAGTWAGWTERLAVAIVFTLFALGEYVADKLPNTPSRTAPVGLGARVLLGCLAGAILATASHVAVLEGVLPGAIAAVVGAFAGFWLRRGIVRKVGCADWPVAVAEDATTMLVAVLALRGIAG